MKLREIFKIALALLMIVVLNSCVEEIPIETGSFQSALVVEGTITTENKIQEIFLSRTSPLGEKDISYESDATVVVTDDLGNDYFFEEISEGKYLSINPFGAVPGRTYALEITTEAGKNYASRPSNVPVAGEIENLYAERVVFNGEDGVAILVDIEGQSNSTGYYRYNYEETYKIISPYSFPYDLVYQNGRFIEVRKTKEERICYNTVESDDIILVNSATESGSSVNRKLVRFIPAEDPILAQRYSIYVQQLSISQEAFAFYETLKEFSGSGSVFSQNQPGFINGNVFSVSDPEEKVVGYFTVAAADEERIFFNFEDLFEEGETKGKFIDCFVSRPEVSNEAQAETLGEELNSGRVKYLGTTIVPGGPNSGPYRVVQAGCVDCTVLGTNIQPEFWEE